MEKIFTPEIKKQTDQILSRYETKRASILEILRFFQERRGYIDSDTELAVAEYLDLPPIDVREVMTFYSLFYSKPKAKTRFHICRTLSCNLLGAEDLVSHCEKKLGIKAGTQTADGAFSLNTVECLGACEIAPMMQVNDVDYVGQLTKKKIDELIEKNQA